MIAQTMQESTDIQGFYRSWGEHPIYRLWPSLWMKQYKIETKSGVFLNLCSFREKIRFRSLKRYCVDFAPRHVYMSVLNWLMPGRVGAKEKSNSAYPVGGEYVIDIDARLNCRQHDHQTRDDPICERCLQSAMDMTLEVIDAILENYRFIHVVFSGRKGFHVHVWEFEAKDWTHYDPLNPLKSHEVARMKFTEYIKEKVPGAVDERQRIVTSDVCGVISFPEALNGETGLICSYLGSPRMFESLSVPDVINKSLSGKVLLEGGSCTARTFLPTPLP